MTNVNDFKAGMKVRCINSFWGNLTLDNEYEAVEFVGRDVIVIDDVGYKSKYDIRLFEPVAQANDALEAEEVLK